VEGEIAISAVRSMSNVRQISASTTRCVGFFSTSLEDPLLTVDLVLLLIDDESERSHFVITRIQAER
jgi:hypothetical protein